MSGVVRNGDLTDEVWRYSSVDINESLQLLIIKVWNILKRISEKTKYDEQGIESEVPLLYNNFLG